jgi:HK97 family phage portal protein
VKLRDRLGFWIADQLKAYMPGPAGLGFTEGAWTSVAYDYDALGSAYCYNPWVHSAVKRTAEVVSSIPLRVYRQKGRGPDVEREQVYEHPLVDLLWNPGRFSGGTEGLIYRTVADFQLNGEFFWFVENGTGGQTLGGQPTELRIFKSLHMSVTPDPLDIVKAYVLKMSGSEKTFDPEWWVHGKTYNPKDDYRGLPPLEVAKSPVLLQHYMTRYNQLFFANGAEPGFMLSTDQNLNESAEKRIRESWMKRHQGIENKHKLALLWGGLKPVTTAMTHKDAQFIDLEKLTREEVLAIYMMPHVLVGLSESVNYANAREQVRIFFKYTVKPICRFLSGAINTQLIPTWYRQDYENGLYVGFDFSNEEALQADALKQAQERQIYVSSGVMTPNEVRLDLDLEAIDGGDELRSPGGGFGGVLSGNPPMNRKAVIPPTRVDQWKARDRDFIESERKIERTMRAFFVEQGKRVVRELEAVGLLAGVAPNMPETADTVSCVRQVDPDQLFMIFDLDKENEEILAVMRPVLEDIVEQAGNGALASVGAVAQFKVEDPRVQAILAAKDLKIQGINDTTAKVLRSVLVDASAEGVSVAETGRRIRDKFSDFSKTRADTIARTEAVGANNAAATEGYRQSGVVDKKEWLTAPGAATPRHELVVGLDGQQVGLDEMFDVNGFPMTAPGVDGPPEEVINCRCTVLPVLED